MKKPDFEMICVTHKDWVSPLFSPLSYTELPNIVLFTYFWNQYIITIFIL